MGVGFAHTHQLLKTLSPQLPMRRIDIVLIGLLTFGLGGLLYGGLKVLGYDSLDAGRWSQLIFVLGLLGWVLTYLVRVGGRKMTYHQQLDAYEVLQKRLEEMSPEELAALEAEIEAEIEQDPLNTIQ
jgi:hypothetical protein